MILHKSVHEDAQGMPYYELDVEMQSPLNVVYKVDISNSINLKWSDENEKMQSFSCISRKIREGIVGPQLKVFVGSIVLKNAHQSSDLKFSISIRIFPLYEVFKALFSPSASGTDAFDRLLTQRLTTTTTPGGSLMPYVADQIGNRMFATSPGLMANHE